MKTIKILFLLFCTITLSINASAFEDKSWSPDFSQRITIEKGIKYVNSSYRFKTAQGTGYRVVDATSEYDASNSSSSAFNGSASMPTYGSRASDDEVASFGSVAPIYEGISRGSGREKVSGKGDISEYGVKAFNNHGRDDWEYRGLSTPNFSTQSDDDEPVPVGDAFVPLLMMLVAFAAFKFIKK